MPHHANTPDRDRGPTKLPKGIEGLLETVDDAWALFEFAEGILKGELLTGITWMKPRHRRQIAKSIAETLRENWCHEQASALDLALEVFDSA